MRKIAASLYALTACALLGAVPSAHATFITYDVLQESSNSWVYSYEVTNDGSAPIEEFTIWFDLDLYSNLSLVSTAQGWDPLVIQRDLGLPHDGFFDALADLGAALAPGLSLGGFSVRFDFLGAGRPGSQAFDILSTDPFGVVESGVTRPRVIVPVSEPMILVLWMLGALSVAVMAVRNFCTGVSRPSARSPHSQPSE
jgi:hypothetical protein